MGFAYFMLSFIKRLVMKKYIDRSESVSEVRPGLDDDKIFLELEIAQRTQIPPSEELINKLNQLASKAPLFVYKAKKYETVTLRSPGNPARYPLLMTNLLPD
jgi:hypothetical protein